MKLNEALKRQKIKYQSVRKNYKIHDPNPDILILDPDYPPDKGDGILAFNLNYLDDLTKEEKKKLIKDIQKYDNSILDIKGVKAFLRKIVNIGDYGFDKDTKIKRYRSLVKKFPVLKKIIRHYKKTGIK